MARTKDETLAQRRRQRILEAAASVFKDKGFHAARTEDICAAAELSPGTVFRHFPSKQAIIEAIIAMEIGRFREQVAQIGSEAGLRWLARLNATGLVQLLSPSELDLGADSWLELSRSRRTLAEVQRLHLDLRDTLAAALKAGQKAGWVRPELHPRGMATVILALFSGLVFDAEMQLPTDHAATAKAIADLFSRHVLA